ncbi:hypothetical protein FQZ97_1094900 [compost metagenome]
MFKPGGEVAGVVAAESLAPILGAVITLAQDAGTRLEVQANIECFSVGIQAVFRQVVAIDLSNTDGEVVALFFQLANRRQRLFKAFRLTCKIPTHNADGERIA